MLLYGDWVEQNVLAPVPHRQPEVLIDARMRKRVVPEPQRELAPLAIGIGPTSLPATKSILPSNPPTAKRWAA